MFGTLILTMLLFVTVIYFAALYLRDASIMDIFWGVGFILIAVQSLYIAFYNNLDVSLPKLIATGLVVIWGARLSLHIFARHNGEDPRYAQWRHDWGSTYVWRSYIQIFLLQGALALIITLPVTLLNFSTVISSAVSMNWLWVGCAIWAAGFLFESVADLQLSYFKSHPANKGKLLTMGLWQYSRHPNYFGEAVQWWGVFVVALSVMSVSWYLLIIGPVVITYFIRFVSGVPLLENRMKRNSQFAHYAAKTNAFIPWFSK